MPPTNEPYDVPESRPRARTGLSFNGRLRACWFMMPLAVLGAVDAVTASATVIAAQALPSPFTFNAGPVIVRGSQDTGFLFGLSCPSPSLCISTAGSPGSRSLTTRRPLANDEYRETGGFPGGFLSENAATCPTPQLCFIAGSIGTNDPATARSSGDNTDPAVARSSGPRVGQSWQAFRLPARRRIRVEDRNLVIQLASTVSSMACPTANLCMALGETSNGVGTPTWRTSNAQSARPTWSLSILQRDRGFDANGGGNISCPTAQLCVAISRKGRVMTVNPSRAPLRWRASRLRSPGHGREAVLDCPSESLCVAFRRPGQTSYRRILFVSNDPRAGGASWKRRDFGITTIQGIDCPTPTLCMATGSPEGRTGFNGAAVYVTTRPQDLQAPWSSTALSGINSARGVSCPSPKLCFVTDTFQMFVGTST